MQNINWDDYRVAFQVAQSGSLSKAARQLECNHATVLRHINRLEKALNIKLFLRHQRGYRLTDAGSILVSEMPNIYKEFNRLETLIGNVEQDISGTLRITTLLQFAPLLNPALLQFRLAYPKLRVQVISTDEVIPLESGTVHVSVRAGAEPQDPDLIVHKLLDRRMSYYATKGYVQQNGLPETVDQYNEHDWVMPSVDKYHIPIVKQVIKHLDKNQIVYQCNEMLAVQAAVKAGLGIGPLAEQDAEGESSLQKLHIEEPERHEGTLWFVYHRDLKNNAKVKNLYRYLVEHLQTER
jgi:DNA-binding transcriptional LysR family regulator